MTAAALKRTIRERAGALGFPLCGFAPLQVPPHAPAVAQWLAGGNAGEMGYIARGMAKRLDPTLVLAGARSVITVAYPYAPPPVPDVDWRADLRGRIAAYAFGPDYHDVVLARLDDLAGEIRALVPTSRTRTYVDTGPILEREWAAQSGLGWFGKNTMILQPLHGSWFFLGEILTDLELDPEPLVADHCGRCRRCLDLCPTGALHDGYRLDARVCISYLTIEYRGVIPIELRPRMGHWIFGCDVCQEVCPWNGTAPVADTDERWPSLRELLRLDEDRFRARFRRSAISRAKRAGLLRNAAVVLGNSGNPDAIPVLARALREDPSPLVRAHSAWAIGVLPGGRRDDSLERARRDPDPAVRAEVERALGV